MGTYRQSIRSALTRREGVHHHGGVDDDEEGKDDGAADRDSQLDHLRVEEHLRETRTKEESYYNNYNNYNNHNKRNKQTE